MVTIQMSSIQGLAGNVNILTSSDVYSTNLVGPTRSIDFLTDSISRLSIKDDGIFCSGKIFSEGFVTSDPIPVVQSATPVNVTSGTPGVIFISPGVNVNQIVNLPPTTTLFGGQYWLVIAGITDNKRVELYSSDGTLLASVARSKLCQVWVISTDPAIPGVDSWIVNVL